MSHSLDGVNERTQPTTARVGLVPWAALLLLLVTSARLVGLNAGQFQQFRRNAERKALVPTIGSLAGIAANGERVTLELADSEFALVFVLRAQQLPADLRVWNDLVARVGPGGYAWGICDSGATCNSSQTDARFRVIGYLDPYGMRSVINADEKGEALLYGKLSGLKARVPRTPDPNVMADAIRKALS